MPCDQVRMTSVLWNKNTDLTKLGDVLGKLGWEVTFRGSSLHAKQHEGYEIRRLTFTGDRMQFNEGTVDVDAIKQEYAVATLQEAEQYGWTVEVEGQEQKATAGFTREW